MSIGIYAVTLSFGDFELDSHLLNLQCTKAQWQSKAENEKENLFKKFLSFGTKQPPQKFVTSTDDKLLLPKTATVARNPEQKRKSNLQKRSPTKDKNMNSFSLLAKLKEMKYSNLEKYF